MRTQDYALLALGAVALYWFARPARATAPPDFVFEGMIPPDLSAPASRWNVPIANRTEHRPFQGGYRSPSELDQSSTDANPGENLPIFASY